MSHFSCCFGKKASPPRHQIDIEEEVSNWQDAKLYTYGELRVATGDFSPSNKIGKGGFGSVYKGRLKDGTLAAIKVLSAESTQGVKEFLNEIIAISGVEHENLVKLYGCCVEEDHRILVYGYVENNSLSQTLLGSGYSNIQFSWSTRSKICIGVARGLAFLHEELKPHIIHRDIKASNILLDKDLTPKIADFGLAKLFPINATHVSTRVAGTRGYLAPEYAMRARLTRKADIYSFGVLLLEIVSGRCNTNKRLPVGDQFLLERAWRLYKSGELVELVDASIECANIDEACRYVKIAFLCTQAMAKSRPSMSTVLEMLTGEAEVDDSMISEPGLISELMGLRVQKKEKLFTASINSGKEGNSSSSGNTSTGMTQATMTFTSIRDRST
uniref:Protein kinase superfamily protein n=1 Tax=Ipomoea pes-caprae TaxID=89656 RepID=A0A2Z4HN48_IPOPC|nr:protein kinase superfamily protein [Ipomoea pes-caprae]